MPRRCEMVAFLAIIEHEQRGGERLAFGFHIVGREARQRVEARARFAADSEGVEVMHLFVERRALPPGRARVLALRIEDEGAPSVSQQMRDDETHALAGARRSHNQDVFFGFQRKRNAPVF